MDKGYRGSSLPDAVVHLPCFGDFGQFRPVLDYAVDGGVDGIAELVKERGFDRLLAGREGELPFWG